MSKKSESRGGLARRTLLKGGLMVLGAGLLVQPSGAVLGLAQETPKQDVKAQSDATVKGGANKTDSKTIKSANKTHKTSKSHKGKHKITTDTPKKEGS